MDGAAENHGGPFEFTEEKHTEEPRTYLLYSLQFQIRNLTQITYYPTKQDRSKTTTIFYCTLLSSQSASSYERP